MEDKRIDSIEGILTKLDDKMDSIVIQQTKINTILIGNGVPGLVENYLLLCGDVKKNTKAIYKIIFGGGGIMLAMTIILNLEKIISIFK